MVTIISVARRSAVLTPSALACLARTPTINLTAGCAHGCIYCYTRGYTNNPGADKVLLYANTLGKLEDELARKRTKPDAVYFSPSRDLFQPLAEVLELGHRILEVLFSNGIGVAFLTKGLIPDRTMRLLLNNRDRVSAQVGIITINEDVRRIFEPNAANIQERLRQIAALTAGGIPTEARLDPILPGITDTPEALRDLFSALSIAGVTHAAASALFLRPAVMESLKRNVRDERLLQCLLGYYTETTRLAIRAERSSVVALQHVLREEIYAAVRCAAGENGIGVSICGCKNPDLARGACNIGGAWPRRPSASAQGSLFDVK
ncbi:MAG: radical SAM protein [Bacillota bacterium]|nr:radical SAM protein [Bacillota bacterium]